MEDIARAVLYGTTKKAGSKAGQLAALADASLAEAVARFNTPNMQNVEALFDSVGFSLGTGWTATIGATALNKSKASDLVNAWLHVRHSIAHGVPFHENKKLVKLRKLPHVKSRVVTGKRAGKGKGIALAAGDADGCCDLFASVQATVASRATSHLALL